MGFKISPFEAFARAERQHDKYNRRNPTSKSKIPTLAEQLAEIEKMEREAKERARQQREEDNKPRFSPLYDAKRAADQKEAERKEREERKRK